MESTEICEVSLVDDTGLLTDTLLGGSSWSRPVIFPSNASAGDLGTLSIPITIVQEPIESQHLVEGFLLSNGDLPGVDREIILSQDTHEEVVEVSQLDNGKTSETETLVNFSGNGYEICIQNEKQPSPVNIPAETSDELVQTVDNDVDPPDRTGGPQNCDTCGLSFTSRKAFRKHIESHLHDKPFKCSQCSESFNYECNLNAHVSTHNVDNPYCIVCKKNFTRFASLRAHVLIHQCDDTLFCPDCLEEFSSQTLLEKHRLEHLAEPAAFKFYECNQCENTYGSQSALRDHLKIVHGVKFQKKVKKRKGSYVCDYCKKRFEKPSQLIRHKRIHTGERPFKCESCGKGFGQKGSLRIHMLKHSGDKPFKCTHCGSCFSQKGNLRAHVIRIHPELYNESRNFKCKLCVSAFHNAAKLSSHVDKFHGGSSQMPEAEAPKAMTRTDTSNKENEEKAVKSTEQVQFLRITAVPAKSPSVPPNRVDNAKPLKKSPELKDALSQTPRIEGFVVKGNSQEAAPKPLLVTLVKEDVIDFFVCPVCNELLSSEEERERHKKLHHNPASAVQISSLELMSTESPSDPLTLANVTKILVMEDGTLGLVKDNYVVQWQTEANLNSASNSPTTVPPESTANEVQMMQTEKLYRCDKCDRSFAALSHWKAHCRAHKDDNLSLKTLPSKPQTSPAPVVTSPQDSKTCKVCEKSFSSHSSLKRHQEVHESSSSIYSCNLCPRQYKSRATFQKHLNTHAKAQSFRAKQAGAETPEKVDKGIEFQGDWNDLVQSLQPGQQYSFDIADGTSDSPGKRIEIRLVKSNPSRTEMMDSERVEKSVPVVSPADDEPVIINDSFSQNSVVKTGNGLSFGLNPPVDGEKPQRRKVFTCDQCVGEFNSLMELSIHKTTHLKMTSKICSICQKSFNSVVAYEKHVRSCTKSVVVNENVRAFKCKHCGHGFFNEREFKSHVSNNNVLTVCEVCSKAFKCKKAHELHVQEHYAIKGIYSCRICNAVFSTEEEMIEHAEVHPIDKQKGTKKKKSNFSRPATTKKLTEEERKLLSTVPPKSVSEKALLNAIIEVERQNVERFQNGVKNEIVESSEEVHPNKCPYCPKSFRKPSDLVRHVRIHTGERPYKCTVCNKTFSIKSTAYSHVKTHTKDRSYSCHLCHKEFACIGSLKVHMRLHTGSMPFSCEICHAKFRTSGHKKAHLANHLKGSSVSNKEKNQSRGKSDRRSKVVALKAATTNESTPTITVALSPAEDSQPLITTPEPSPLQHHPLIPPSAADEVAQAVQYMPSLGESIIYDDSVRDILGNGLVRLDDCASTDVLDLASLPGNCLSSVTNDKPAELKKFVCVYCLKGFETQESLATHTKTHGFLECPVCHQSFKCKTDLEVHTLVHELDQWSCNGCSLAFGDQNTFKKHKCSSDSLGLGGGVVNDLKDLTSSSLDLSLEVNDLFLFPSD